MTIGANHDSANDQENAKYKKIFDMVITKLKKEYDWTSEDVSIMSEMVLEVIKILENK